MNSSAFIGMIRDLLDSGVKQNKRMVDKIAKQCGISDPTQIKELTEYAIVCKAREIAKNEVLSIRQRYDLIVELYRNQVNLSQRTSQSIMLQQYSTPAPISFLASMYIRQGQPETAVYFEPSAGNGLLTIALPAERTIVNEIDDLRYKNLNKQPFRNILQADATEPFKQYSTFFDGIITNPPFGTYYETIKYDKFPIKHLDHLMALRALDCMKDNGKAAIIIGGHTEWDEQGRIQKGKNRIFLSYLYRFYNVEDILLINGELYSRQGTSFNVRLILINGRKATPEGYAPLKDSQDAVISDFDMLFQRMNLQNQGVNFDWREGVNFDWRKKQDKTDKMNKSKIIAQAKLKLQQLQLLDGLQGPYHPVSEAPVKPLDTIVPDSMDYEIHSALLDVKENVGGSINAYVRGYLGYANDEEMAESLSAEQVDAVAMAIYNIEEKGQGMVIGDQTGIGKGRVAAAVIRYACQQGMKPIFITEKANLFSDMYRDLKAVGSADLRPFIVNANESKSKIKDEDGEVVYEPLERSAQEHFFEKQYLGKEFDYLMLTYSQIASEKPTTKQAFINAIAENNVLILDESHNAGGNMETSATARFFYNVVKQAKGVVFLSATFAKRPDNMPLYAAKTCISDASLSNESLVEAIQNGGVALQEVLSANLVSEGQMLRRERSFEGIEVNYITLDKEGSAAYGVHDKEQEHKAIVDNITAVLRDIISFQDKGIMPMIDSFDKAKKMEMTNVEQRKGTKELGVSATPYFSKVFNVINQMLFSVKAEEVAQRAIQRLKEGKAPVIAFSSTMGAFLENMETENGESISDGMIINADFAEVLKRGLSGVLRYSEIDEAGTSIHKELSVSELEPEAQAEYYRISSIIDNIATGISISPIDRIKYLITQAGYSVAEVTGRKLEVKFKNADSHIGMVATHKKELVNDAFRRFNNNEVDVLLINQSGSTGASAHAIVTPKVPLSKVRQRVMIVLQAELDINREVQKRGRINRTGQMFKPIYDYVNSAIPAEKRLAMMLQKKLKSLDANTTSNQKNSQALLQSDDFLNKYGDKLVLEYLTENPEINEAIGDPLGICKAGEEKKKNVDLENAASQVSGRVAVLPTADQQRFYDDMVERYQNYVAYLLQIGDYDLEVETMDLQAQTLNRSLKIAGKGGSKSFGGNTYLEKCEVNILKKPFKKQELDNILKESLNGRTAEEIAEELEKKLREFATIKRDEELKKVEERSQKAITNITNEKKYKALQISEQEFYYRERLKAIEQAKEEAKKVTENKLKNQYGFVLKMLQFFKTGEAVNYPSVEYGSVSPSLVPALFLGFKINFSKPNPFAPSAVIARFAITNSSKYFEFTLSGEQGVVLERIISASYRMSAYEKQEIIDKWDELIQKSMANRGIRYVYTGNLLQAYGSNPEKYKLISYTTSDGGTKKGILLPESWENKTSWEGEKTTVPLIKAINVLKSLSFSRTLETDNGLSFLKMVNGFKLITSSLSVQRFDFIIKNPDILKYIENAGGFQKIGTCWSGFINDQNIEAVAKIIHQVSNCTVSLNSSQVELIQHEIEKEDNLENPIFPKLVELEVKLFALIKDQTNGFAGFGNVGVMVSLALLRQYYPLQNLSSERSKVLANMVDEVKVRTNNFTNADIIGTEKVEVKYLLEKEHIAPSQWIEYKHTFKRSEADVVEWLANEVQKIYIQNQSTTAIESDKDKRIRITKVKAQAKLKLLKLLAI